MKVAVAGCAFGVAACLALGTARAETAWTPDLVVPRGEAVVLGSECVGKTNTGMTVHGDLTVCLGNRYSKLLLCVLDGDGNATNADVPVSVGPDAGDDATLEVQKSELSSFFSNGHGLVGDMAFGERGGNGRLWLHATDDVGGAGAGVLMRQVRLAEKARTDADVFDAVKIGSRSELSVHELRNENTKPMRVTFENRENDVGNAGALMLFAGRAVARLPVAGGDLVFAGGANAPVRIQGWYGWGWSLFVANTMPKGCVRFEGDCDVRLEPGRHAAATLNTTNVVWNHAGDLVVGPFTKPDKDMAFVVDEADVLPRGPQTGNVVARAWPGADFVLKVQLKKTSQKLNGLDLGENVCLDAPAGTTLTFGEGDADGVLAGAVTNAEVSCVKTGAGTLTLSNATVRALSATGGVVDFLAGTANRVKTFAVTNATVRIAPNAAVEVENWLLGPNADVAVVIPASAQTNEMAALYATMPDVPLVKEGAGLVTCATVDDAKGMPMHVKGGVLRMGGCVCTNDWWRFVVRRAMVDSHHFTDASVPEFSRDVTLMLGSIGMFSPDGMQCMGAATGAADGTAAADLAEGFVSSAKPVMPWSIEIYQSLYPGAQNRPILGGGTAASGAMSFVNFNRDDWKVNCYDLPATNQASAHITAWSSGVLFTNAVIRPEVPGTWETVSWRVKKSWKDRAPASYALRRCVNSDGADRPHATDWTLESSPNGVDWEVMDVRSNQTFTTTTEGPRLNAQFNYTYNAHVPYLFSAKRAEWKFTTYGAVQVDAGAVLDMDELDEGNVAFNALKVDFERGAGAITKFVPAPDGVLHLVNAPVDAAGRLRASVDVGLELRMVAGEERLKTWTVVVNGVRSTASRVSVRDGRLVVDTAHGTMVILR